ncbi:MAG TPA: hypothetical protein VKI65_04615, partial [Gemmataceae bacterium]|nr:hypothetical protein [Gemmataceae bacterium]
WKRFARDDNPRFLDNVPFVKAPLVEGMVNALSTDFQCKGRVQDDLLRFGADVTKLPRPAKRSDESGDRE